MKKLILIYALLLACEPAPEEVKSKEADIKSIQVRTLEIKKQNIDDYFEVSAQLRGHKEIDLISNVSGRVERFTENGSYIYKGKSIFEIESKLFKQQMSSAKSQFETAQKSAMKLEEDLKKYKSLLDSKDISLDEYKNHELSMLNAQQNAHASQVQFQQAKMNFENAVYIAPFSGYVGQIDLTNGQSISPGTVIGKLADLSKLKSVLHLSIDEATRFQKGNKAIFKNGELELEGLVESISPIADSQTGTYLTKVIFMNSKKKRVISGMFGTIKLIGNRYESAFVVKNDNIIFKDNEHFIFLAKDNTSKRTRVQIVKNIGQESVILADIETGDKLIISSVGRLADNVPVKEIQ